MIFTNQKFLGNAGTIRKFVKASLLLLTIGPLSPILSCAAKIETARMLRRYAHYYYAGGENKKGIEFLEDQLFLLTQKLEACQEGERRGIEWQIAYTYMALALANLNPFNSTESTANAIDGINKVNELDPDKADWRCQSLAAFAHWFYGERAFYENNYVESIMEHLKSTIVCLEMMESLKNQEKWVEYFGLMGELQLVYESLAKAYEKAGDYKSAKEAWDRAEECKKEATVRQEIYKVPFIYNPDLAH